MQVEKGGRTVRAMRSVLGLIHMRVLDRPFYRRCAANDEIIYCQADQEKFITVLKPVMRPDTTGEFDEE